MTEMSFHDHAYVAAPDDQITGLRCDNANKAGLSAIKVSRFRIRIRKAGQVVNIIDQVRAIRLGVFAAQRPVVIGDGIDDGQALVPV